MTSKTRLDGGLKLSAYLPYELSVASNRVSQLIARAYEARFGLSIPQWRLIAVLGETDGLTQKEICARTAMDKVTVSRAVAALSRRHLLARAPHHSDGRSTALALSEEGASLYQSVSPLALEYERALLSDLGPQELALFRKLLRRLGDKAAALAGGPAV